MSKKALIFSFCCLIWCLAPGRTVAQMAGDANADSVVDLGDVLYEINYLYRGGPVPQSGCAFL